MSTLVFLAHLPLLRIAEEEIPLGRGTLWRLPFPLYNELSLGAFEDHEAAYTATAPVFYRIDADLELPSVEASDGVAPGAIELKMPSENWEYLGHLGLEFLLRFHGALVEPARAALLLAAPACAIPTSMLSVTFVRLVESGGFRLGDTRAGTIRVQGDADQEYLFLADAAGPPLPAEVVRDAESRLDLVGGLSQQPELLAATKALLGATAPMLSPLDQLVLAVRALEALLLPDVMSGLGSTFARRLSRLLGTDAAHRDALVEVARTLYETRSATLHGAPPHSWEPARTAAAHAYGPQLLAAAIRRLGEQAATRPVADQREALDAAEPAYAPSRGSLPLDSPPGLLRPERMLRLTSRLVATIASGVDMGAKDATVSWSPLIGLEAKIEAPLSRGSDGVALLTLSGEEMVGLEQRDTRRDFIAQLRVAAEPAAVLMTGFPEQPPTTMERIAPLLRRRDLATVALRLAGFSQFYDPELLGVFVYQDSIRTRYPSVMRQTIEQKMRTPALEAFTEEDIPSASDFMALLLEYDRTASHPQVDEVLRLFRHGFAREFLPAIARAALLLSAIEAMLGRFRKPQELEGLIATVAGDRFPEAVAWFQQRGRRFRNSIAHGEWPSSGQDPEPLQRLIELLRALIPEFVRVWLNEPNRASVSPLRAFVSSVAEGV